MKLMRTFLSRIFVVVCVLQIVHPALAATIAAQREWSRVLSTSELESTHGVATDADGNAYLVGSTFGSLFAPLTQGENPFLAKYSPTGNRLWGVQTNYGGYFYDVNASAARAVYASGNGGLSKYDSNGSFLWNKWIAGGMGSPVLDGSGRIFVCGQANDGNTCISGLDSSGNWAWTTEIPTFRPSTVSLALDATGNPIVGSEGWSSDYNYRLGYVAKCNTAGQLLWRRQVGSSTGKASVEDIVTDSAGGIYVVGATSQSLLGEAVTNSGFLMKYDSSGNAQWIRRYAYPSGQGTGLAIDPTGALCVLGDGANLFRYNLLGDSLDTITGITAAGDVSIRDFAFSKNILYTVGEVNGPGVVDVYINKFVVSPIPEPSTFALLGISVFGLIIYAWRRRS